MIRENYLKLVILGRTFDFNHWCSVETVLEIVLADFFTLGYNTLEDVT